MKPTDPTAARDLRRLRVALGVFILGLVLSGVTAFPLESELDLAARWFGLEGLAAGGGTGSHVAAWVLHVREALHVTYARYPFIAYGTDWLAFGHLVIAMFFVGPFIDPVRNVAVLRTGLWACVLVLPLALVCGPLRGVPFFWRLIDCSFGAGGFPLLWYCVRAAERLRGRWDDRETPTAARNAPPDEPPAP